MDVDEAKEVGDDDLEVEQQKANAQLQKECKVYGKEIAQERKINKSMARNTLHVQSSLVLDQKAANKISKQIWNTERDRNSNEDALAMDAAPVSDVQTLHDFERALALWLRPVIKTLLNVQKERLALEYPKYLKGQRKKERLLSQSTSFFDNSRTGSTTQVASHPSVGSGAAGGAAGAAASAAAGASDGAVTGAAAGAAAGADADRVETASTSSGVAIENQSHRKNPWIIFLKEFQQKEDDKVVLQCSWCSKTFTEVGSGWGWVYRKNAGEGAGGEWRWRGPNIVKKDGRKDDRKDNAGNYISLRDHIMYVTTLSIPPIYFVVCYFAGQLGGH